MELKTSIWQYCHGDHPTTMGQTWPAPIRWFLRGVLLEPEQKSARGTSRRARAETPAVRPSELSEIRGQRLQLLRSSNVGFKNGGIKHPEFLYTNLVQGKREIYVFCSLLTMEVSNIVISPSATDLVESASSVRLSCSALVIGNVTPYEQGPFRSRVFNSLKPVRLSISCEKSSWLACERLTVWAVSPLNCVNFTGRQLKTHSAFLTTHTETNQTQTCLCSFTHCRDGPEHFLLKPSPLQDHNTGGSNIDLMCSADSRPLALIYWFQNGVLLSGTGPQIKLANVERKRSSKYRCRAFNNKTMRNGASSPAAISILGTPHCYSLLKLWEPNLMLISSSFCSTSLQCGCGVKPPHTCWSQPPLWASSAPPPAPLSLIEFVSPMEDLPSSSSTQRALTRDRSGATWQMASAARSAQSASECCRTVWVHVQDWRVHN